MPAPLKVLIVDDSEQDALLIVRELQQRGYEPAYERVETPKAIKAALEQKAWDVVISNFVVSQCTALEVLALLQEKNLDLPFIIVSDTMSEDIALQAMKAGAHSFFKKKNIKLLVPAVERGLREVTIQRERKRAEEKLKVSEQNYRELYENLRDGWAQIDEYGRIVQSNPAFRQMTGYSEEELLHLTYKNLTPEKWHAIENRILNEQVRARGYSNLYEKEYRRKDGTIFPIELRTYHVPNEPFPASWAFVREITERKQAEEALKVSGERFRIAAEATNDLIWEWNIINGTLEWFGAIDEKLGYFSREFPRTIEAWENSIHPDDHDRVMASLDRHLKTKASYYEEYFIKRKDGTFRFWIDQGKAVWDAEGNPLKMIGACTDITERKQAEEALRQSQLQQKALLDNIPDAAWLKDSESRFVAVNEALAKASGYSTENLVGKTDFEIWPKDDAELYRSEDQEIIATKQKKVIEQSFMDSSGKVSWVEKIKTPILDEKEKVIGTAGISRNITKRKQTEQELRENERKYQSFYQEFLVLFDAVPENMHLISPDLKLIWINQTSAASLNKTRSDLIGQYCYQVRHNRSEPCEICPVQKTFHSKRIEFDEVTAPDGVVWDLRAAPIIDDQGEVKSVVELARNITEKKKAFQDMISLQEQLRQSQKMEAIGRLAGGVAHDFNNLLTVIQVNTELALRGLAHDDSLKLKLDDIKKATERAANLTRQLLAFSRRQVLNLKVINLNFILEDLEKMLHRIIGEEIELITSFADDLGRVKADPGEIEQVIINLAVNAKDAMPHGGTLTIATANVELDDQYVRGHLGTLPGSYVAISVADTGVGIPKEIHEQIFDPFFTTKEKGKGTGLGLATVYGIVKQSGGDIQVYSELGKGTTFKVYFPRVDEPLEVIEKKEGAEEAPRGNETILVVEDDSSVRKIAVQILMNQGYNVMVAESGGDALLICEQEKNPIHLVLTDVLMPKMSGPELIERLKKVRKDFKVLYMSGYTEKHILKGLDKELNFIQKPFAIGVFAQKVRDVLDTKKGSKRK